MKRNTSSPAVRQLKPPSLAAGSAFALVGVLIASAPLVVGGFETPFPIFALAPIFLWGVTRAGISSACTVFALGLVYEVVRSEPIGVWTLSFLIAYMAAAMQRDILGGQSRVAIVAGFGVSAGAFLVAAVVAAFLANGSAPRVDRLAIDVAVTIVLSPILAAPLGGFEKVALLAGDQS